MCQCLSVLVVHGHGRGKLLVCALVLEPRVSCVMNLQHVPIFEYSGCAWTWTRHAPRYMPRVYHMCYSHCCMRD